MIQNGKHVSVRKQLPRRRIDSSIPKRHADLELGGLERVLLPVLLGLLRLHALRRGHVVGHHLSREIFENFANFYFGNP